MYPMLRGSAGQMGDNGGPNGTESEAQARLRHPPHRACTRGCRQEHRQAGRQRLGGSATHPRRRWLSSRRCVPWAAAAAAPAPSGQPGWAACPPLAQGSWPCGLLGRGGGVFRCSMCGGGECVRQGDRLPLGPDACRPGVANKLGPTACPMHCLPRMAPRMPPTLTLVINDEPIKVLAAPLHQLLEPAVPLVCRRQGSAQRSTDASYVTCGVADCNTAGTAGH